MSENLTHWKNLYNPDYFGAYCFNESQDIVLTIAKMTREMVKGEGGKAEECTIMHFIEDAKPLICNKTNCKAITKLYKTPYIEEWRGRKIQLYADRNVRFGKDIVEGVRVRPFPPKITEAETKCTDCNAIIGGFGKMNAQQMAEYTFKNYGKPLCADCATKAANNEKKVEDVL